MCSSDLSASMSSQASNATGAKWAMLISVTLRAMSKPACPPSYCMSQLPNPDGKYSKPWRNLVHFRSNSSLPCPVYSASVILLYYKRFRLFDPHIRLLSRMRELPYRTAGPPDNCLMAVHSVSLLIPTRLIGISLSI